MSEFINDLRSIYENEEDNIHTIIEVKTKKKAEMVAKSIKDTIKTAVQKGEYIKKEGRITVEIGKRNSKKFVPLPLEYNTMEIAEIRENNNYYNILKKMSSNEKEIYYIRDGYNCHDFEHFELTFFSFLPEIKSYSNMWQTKFYKDYIFSTTSFRYSKKYKDLYISNLKRILARDGIQLRIFLTIDEGDRNIATYDIINNNPKIDMTIKRTQRAIDYGIVFEVGVKL